MQTIHLPNNPILLAEPTRARYTVLAFLSSMATVLYLDRVCIAQALKPMKDEFGFSNTEATWVLMAFTAAYGLFEVPTGRWGDRFGSRRVLTRIVLWWSAFTALTGSVWAFSIDLTPIPVVITSLWLLIAIRFLFGAGEAGAIPNAARIIKIWFPLSERGRVQGVFQASMHVGGTIAPMVAALIIEWAGWRWTFFLFGIAGVVWAAIFFWWFRDQPAEHPSVNQAEAQYIGTPNSQTLAHSAVPWREVLAHPSIWLLSMIIVLSSFNSYLFFSWYSTYLQEARGVNNLIAGRLSAMALAGATVGSLLGGYFADLITKRTTNPYRARRLLCLCVFFGAAGCLFASVNTDEAWLSALWCAAACLLMFCQLPTWWCVAFEVAGKHTGTLFGVLNGVGVFGAMASQYFFGAFADWRAEQGFAGREQWDPAFYACVATLIVAGILWQFMWARNAIGERADDTDGTVHAAEDGATREGLPPARGS
jgi:MFS transporter, ACS family, glucarate transporter